MTEVTRIPWYRRLYVRIYLSVLAIVAVLVAMLMLADYSHANADEYSLSRHALAVVAIEALPPTGAPAADTRGTLARWQSHLPADLAIYGADGRVQATAGQADWIEGLPTLRIARLGALPDSVALPLADGRWLLLHERAAPSGHARRPFVFAALVALAVAMGCFLIARRLTRRLEDLQLGVTTWGAGELSKRTVVEGHDEVAELARAFNRSGARIESLLRAQRALLANASHELRSPLARLRLAAELLPASTDAPLHDEFLRNIAELDQLVGEILLASRLDAQGGGTIAAQHVDLTALVAAQCAATGAILQAEPTGVRGDPVLLGRLLRNLVENARRHGGDGEVRVQLITSGDTVELVVSDEGPGIAPAERERVFEPFYRLPGASEADGGVGLGLALVRQIAVAHGGTAQCVEAAGAGARFVVRLPASPAATSG
ncbi:MAG: sensor histidine kinase [Arenimonas sp.]